MKLDENIDKTSGTRQFSDSDFTSLQKEGEIKIDPFKKNPDNKYISTVSDEDMVIEENSRYKYLASYISNIKDLKISQYKKSGGSLILEKEIILKFK